MKIVKCVVWDLDNTLWRGTLLEDKNVQLSEGVLSIIETLDKRGILQSVASKNAAGPALEKLKEFGVHDYFLYTQINWSAKSASLIAIANALNISVDSLAFVDDQPFEREEVQYSLPSVLCFDAVNMSMLVDHPRLSPSQVTESGANRRRLYLTEQFRKQAEEEFIGVHDEFLKSLEMTLTIAPADEDSLRRMEELTIRTHQLNSTGYTYSYEQLDEFRRSNQHLLLAAELDDKFGPYGKIGLALVECSPQRWTIKLLIMSCRVLSRGVGAVLLGYIMTLAKAKNVKLNADFVATETNRAMLITYRLAGFREIESEGEFSLLEAHPSRDWFPPAYFSIEYHAPLLL